ncbi:MAG: hypothetical protein Q8K82_10550 [Gemmatimonadaceae bacterium]|nr:hypothetical protein [Gemmatimonadaceae bacterium]
MASKKTSKTASKTASKSASTPGSSQGSSRTSSRRPRGGGAYRGLPPKDSQRITLFEAVELTQRYRKAAPASEHGGFFWAEGFRDVLDQPGCVGLRYYHGLDDDGQYRIVIVGVDSSGADMVKPAKQRASARVAKAAVGEATAVLLDRSWPCPPMCDPNSPLL